MNVVYWLHRPIIDEEGHMKEALQDMGEKTRARRCRANLEAG